MAQRIIIKNILVFCFSLLVQVLKRLNYLYRFQKKEIENYFLQFKVFTQYCEILLDFKFFFNFERKYYCLANATRTFLYMYVHVYLYVGYLIDM